MQVELYVQDAFYELIEKKQFPTEEGENYIAPSTWETWINNWFQDLHENLSSRNQAIAKSQNYEIGLRLTDDTEIQQLNNQYRHINQPTDVLAFASLEDLTPRSPELTEDVPLYLGDIIVSVDTAERQARQQGHSLADELVWLVSHGFLHLLGWEHPDDESLQQMLKQQVYLLHLIGMEINIEFPEQIFSS